MLYIQNSIAISNIRLYNHIRKDVVIMKKQLGMCILAPDLDCPEHTEKRECSIDNDKCSFYSKSEQKPDLFHLFYFLPWDH